MINKLGWGKPSINLASCRLKCWWCITTTSEIKVNKNDRGHKSSSSEKKRGRRHIKSLLDWRSCIHLNMTTERRTGEVSISSDRNSKQEDVWLTGDRNDGKPNKKLWAATTTTTTTTGWSQKWNCFQMFSGLTGWRPQTLSLFQTCPPVRSRWNLCSAVTTTPSDTNRSSSPSASTWQHLPVNLHHIHSTFIRTASHSHHHWCRVSESEVQASRILSHQPLQVELCAWRHRQGLSSLITHYKVGSMNEKQVKCLQRRLPLTLLQRKCVSGLFRGDFLHFF